MPERRPLFDAHFHVIDTRFPIYENNGYLPDEFTVGDYRARTEKLHVTGGAIVSGSFQGRAAHTGRRVGENRRRRSQYRVGDRSRERHPAVQREHRHIAHCSCCASTTVGV
jgi:predicted TIM-barrel fold metal-dependent hydrolase